MAKTLRDVMTSDPVMVSKTAAVADPVRLMTEHDIGDVLVVNEGQTFGIVTDGDIVVRGIAEGGDPQDTPLESICSQEPVYIQPQDRADDAARLMRKRASAESP